VLELKINNSLDVARWEKLKCSCNMEIEVECYPFVKCEHCRCKECWDSVPKEDFQVIDTDKDNKKTTRTVSEITLIRGHDLQDVIGWQWQ